MYDNPRRWRFFAFARGRLSEIAEPGTFEIFIPVISIALSSPLFPPARSAMPSKIRRRKRSAAGNSLSAGGTHSRAIFPIESVFEIGGETASRSVSRNITSQNEFNSDYCGTSEKADPRSVLVLFILIDRGEPLSLLLRPGRKFNMLPVESLIRDSLIYAASHSIRLSELIPTFLSLPRRDDDIPPVVKEQAATGKEGKNWKRRGGYIPATICKFTVETAQHTGTREKGAELRDGLRPRKTGRVNLKSRRTLPSLHPSRLRPFLPPSARRDTLVFIEERR